MSRRVLVDVVVGVVLAVGSQIFLYGAYLVLLLAGASLPYDSAPSEPGSHPDWLAQISLMSLVAAVPVFVAAVVVAWLLTTHSAGEGARRGLTWSAVVIAWTLLLAVGNGTTAMFGVPGLWVFIAAFALGPVAAAGLGMRRRAAESSAADEGMAHHRTPRAGTGR